MHRKRSAKSSRNLPRRKKASRAVKKPKEVIRSVTITYDDKWLLKNFLTAQEKRVLVGFYRDQISKILKQDKGEWSRDESDEHDVKRFGKRITFIMEHF